MRERSVEFDEFLSFLSEEAAKTSERDFTRSTRAAVSAAGRNTLFFGQLEKALAKTFKDKLPVPKAAKPKKKSPIDRILNVVLSDTHYGSDLDPREVGTKYGPREEIRRTASIIKQVADYKRQYREHTKLYVHALGDLFQGALHDPREGVPLAQQICQTIYIMVRALRYLAAEFPRGVVVFCATGNHGRRTERHLNRAIQQKWDSNETIVYFALKTALANVKNVEVRLNYAPFYEFDVFGRKGVGTHGDTYLKPGFPGSTIETKSLKTQIANLNHGRILKGLKPFELVVVGHVHTGSMTHVAKNCTLVTNGPLVPPDAYAISSGYGDTACGQWIWESTARYIKGDARFAEVDEETDADATLDSILGEPFSGIDQ
jgi:hypothetical protein